MFTSERESFGCSAGNYRSSFKTSSEEFVSPLCQCSPSLLSGWGLFSGRTKEKIKMCCFLSLSLLFSLPFPLALNNLQGAQNQR